MIMLIKAKIKKTMIKGNTMDSNDKTSFFYSISKEITNMHFKKYLLLLFAITYFQLSAQDIDLSYYLPNISYNESISTPKEFLGYEVGEWHVSHDQLQYYMKHLASQSDRIEIKEIGRSHENRPLLNLIITSPENHKIIDKLKSDHRALTDPNINNSIDINSVPVVIYQGYSIHGNEASGGNAALLNAYYLAAGQSEHLDELLNESVIILDPCYNPDGFHRFSTWVNEHKGKNVTSDPNHREYTESWPRGRTNHYWFDLNRDWLLLTHPESEARIKVFHEWKPDILTDHHEMGTNSTFFFQPGVPERTNPNTPQINQDLTFEIGKFHAAELDNIGSLYYTKESFDDYYYGKGSTYPDINGGIGILFEQASSRGHAQESDHGILTFPFTIRNQFVTSISTQKAGLALKDELLQMKREFFNNAQKEAQKSSIKGYVFGSETDEVRTNRFIEILESHDIEVFELSKSVTANGKKFNPNHSFLVPTDQYQYKLIKTIFEEVNTFQDSLFYDVSAWTLPHAFDLDFAPIKGNINGYKKARSNVNPRQYLSLHGDDTYAYLIDWSAYYAPSLLNTLLKNDLVVRVSHKDFEIKSNGINQNFRKGTLILPSENQPLDKEQLQDLIADLSSKYKTPVTGVPSGLTESGFSLGSPSMSSLDDISVGIFVGNGVNSYDAGHAWHQLDVNFNMATPLLDISNISRINIEKYDVIIMPDGNYGTLNGQIEKLKKWLNSGGQLIASKRAIGWLATNGMCNVERVPANGSNKLQANYGDRRKERGAKVTGGTIVNMKVDLTHPLFYGYNDPYIATFKKGNHYFKPLNDIYNTPGRYTDDPVLSGYMHADNLKKMKGAASVFSDRQGRGKVIGIVDNPSFRGYWWGTSKLLANAIFMGQVVN